jgi:hypothetical protein
MIKFEKVPADILSRIPAATRILLEDDKKLQDAMKAGNFEMMSTLYYNMARLLRREGRNSLMALKGSQQSKLLAFQQQGLETVEIIWFGNGCQACKELDGKKYSIEKALKEMPLPNRDCSMDGLKKGHSWCRCIYKPVV